MRDVVAAGSVYPRKAFAWVCRVQAPDVQLAELDDPGELETLDAKLASGLGEIVHGSLAADIAILTEQLAAEGRLLSGRRKLRMIYNSFETSKRRGALYSWQDLSKIKLRGDNLERFLAEWESGVQGLAAP